MADRCGCGAVTGARCEREALSDAVVVDWMPEWLRASHTAAGNAGEWPVNGAERLAVHPDCVAVVRELGGPWCTVRI